MRCSFFVDCCPLNIEWNSSIKRECKYIFIIYKKLWKSGLYRKLRILKMMHQGLLCIYIVIKLWGRWRFTPLKISMLMIFSSPCIFTNFYSPPPSYIKYFSIVRIAALLLPQPPFFPLSLDLLLHHRSRIVQLQQVTVGSNVSHVVDILKWALLLRCVCVCVRKRGEDWVHLQAFHAFTFVWL